MGQTSSSWASRRMLSARSPSRSISSSATSRIRSRESWGGSALLRICTAYCTVYNQGMGENVPGRSTTRALVCAALAGQVVFIVAWVVAGALQADYSAVDQGVSELAARGASHPAIVTAGLVAFGASFAALGVALLGALPRGRAARVACGLFVAAGAAIVLTAAFRLDCGAGADAHCRALWRAGRLSWHQDAHAWAGFASQLLLTAPPFALAAALWPAPSGLAALGSGAFGLGVGLAAAGAEGGGAGEG